MADISARIAILGAGPIGLETALYARYLGFQVEVLELSESVAANVVHWGHVQLFTPFGMNASPLGVAAVRAHDVQLPAANELLTGADYQQRYLQPLAASDLLVDTLRFDTKVLGIGRRGWLKQEGVGNPRRADTPFHLLCCNAVGKQWIHEAEIVIDCTGTYGNHNWIGQGGIPAVGELVAAEHIEYGIPDIQGRDRNKYLGRHTLVVGSGYSAATTVTQLVRLSDEQPEVPTQVTWATRRRRDCLPIDRIVDDRLPNRDRLAEEANCLAAASSGCLSYLAETEIVALVYREATDDFEVEFCGPRAGSHMFDRVVANVGYRPDNRIYAEMHVHECFASGGPMKLAAQMLATRNPDTATDCLDQQSCGAQSLLNPEPNLYILGCKSYGRSSQFLLSVGFQQIRDLFTVIAERDDLDLYATMPQLAK